MTEESPASVRYQTVVVAKDQLTTDNLRLLAENGWTVVTDPSLIIFARPVPATPNGAGADEGLEQMVSLPAPNRAARRTRKRE